LEKARVMGKEPGLERGKDSDSDSEREQGLDSE
jgi:hypothetical protein